MKVMAKDAQKGQILRRLGAPANDGIYYRAAVRPGRTLEQERTYHLNRVSATGSVGSAKLTIGKTGRDEWLRGRLQAGGVPIYRIRRWRDADGNKQSSQELTVAMPEYEFRVVKNKPGYR